jgi:hypothetical protein
MLGIDAIREFSVLTDTYGAEIASAREAGRGRDSVRHERLAWKRFEFLATALWISQDISTGYGHAFRRNRSAAHWEGHSRKIVVPVRELRRYQQSLAVSNVSVVPDDQARLISAQCRGRVYEGG